MSALSVTFFALNASAEPGPRLAATGGVTNVEGVGGGGLSPWALITGYETDASVDASVYATDIVLQDYALQSYGVALGMFNRLEVSVAKTGLDLQDIGRRLKLADHHLGMNTFGLKYRLLGDAIFAPQQWWPQLSLGLEYKSTKQFEILPSLLKARDDHDTEIYVSASKLYFAALWGRNVLVNVTERRTRANQLGLLGFGGPDNACHWETEATLALMLSDRWVWGAEYRQKPDNGLYAGDEQHPVALHETNAVDSFIAWFPVKSWSFTIAYVDLGAIAEPLTSRAHESGVYLSAQALF